MPIRSRPSLDSAINKTSGADTSLTLEAERNVTVNAGITSTSGALDVNLHSDTDGDGLGAVLINADIATNGGTFKSGSGDDRVRLGRHVLRQPG